LVVDTTVTPSTLRDGGIDPDLQPGQVVGEYRVEAKLGQGGFGAVFKAAHPLIGKLVAIKVLSQRFSVDPEMVSRFVAEARAVNQIRHHNIIDIFSFGTLDDGRHYYVMEYLDGEPLDRRIARQGQLSLREALPILRAIGRALDAAHAKGIAHRDLKAENVFLASNPDGVFPKLLDFGIAKLLAPEDGLKHKTRTGAPLGTPHYMSPEQCHGRDVDHRTDLYAFGVLAYVMLTGVYPLDGDDYMTILMRQLHDEPPPASSHRPDLPAGVDRVIAWLMRKDPAARPASFGEAMKSLEHIASGELMAAEAPSASTRLATAATPSSLPDLPAFPSGKRTPSAGPTALSETQAAGPPRPAAMSASPTGAPTRWTAPRRLLALGALGAAIVVAVAVLAIRAASRAEPPAQAPAKPTLAAAGQDAAPASAVRAPEATVASAEPADVVLTIAGTPPNTEVRHSGVLVGLAPGRVQLPRSATEVLLVLTADGFVPETISVIPSQDLTRTVALKPRATPVPPVPPPPSRTEAARPATAKPGAARPGHAPRAGSAAPPGSDEPTNDIEQFPPPKP
jgi:serine/threonine-protein kinase